MWRKSRVKSKLSLTLINRMYWRHKCKSSVKNFPKNNDTPSFSLVGVIHYSGGRNIKSVGHYIAYSLHRNEWILFHDLLKKCSSVTEDNTTVNPTICLYVKITQ